MCSRRLLGDTMEDQESRRGVVIGAAAVIVVAAAAAFFTLTSAGANMLGRLPFFGGGTAQVSVEQRELGQAMRALDDPQAPLIDTHIYGTGDAAVLERALKDVAAQAQAAGAEYRAALKAGGYPNMIPADKITDAMWLKTQRDAITALRKALGDLDDKLQALRAGIPARLKAENASGAAKAAFLREVADTAARMQPIADRLAEGQDKTFADIDAVLRTLQQGKAWYTVKNGKLVFTEQSVRLYYNNFAETVEIDEMGQGRLTAALKQAAMGDAPGT